MIDVRRVRADPAAAKASLARRGVPGAAIDDVVAVDGDLRDRARRRDDVRSRINAVSRDVGAAYRAGERERAEALKADSVALAGEEETLAKEVAELEAHLRLLLLDLPNLPAEEAPDGASASDNVVLRMEGERAGGYDAHQRVAHWDIGAELGILDLERGSKLSGSMFVVYRGAGATLVRALCQLALDRNADSFEEIRPPTLVRTDTMTSTGHLPKFADDAYHLERDDLWAIPTSEVPLTSLGRDEVLDESDLPVRLMAHTSCFRREAGSAGRDTRGLLRVHEFDKVEILAYATPEQAAEVHADLLTRAEGLLGALGLTYRVVELCSGDLGNSAARTFDLEAYAPGCDMWLEVSSVSWFSDYQARRANLRYRPAAGGPTAMVHTLNGSALAVPRVWAALVETYRQPDGSVLLPDALHPYFRGASSIGVR